MAYNMIRNGKCEGGFGRIKWKCLGRTMSSQSSNAIDENGVIFTWGQNYWGQSGQGDCCWLGGTVTHGELADMEYAAQLPMVPEGGFVKICSGESSSIALHKNGDLWGWGDQDYSECSAFGLPADSGTCHTCCRGVPMAAGYYGLFYHPVHCTPGYKWKDIAHSYYHSMGIGLDDNKLYTWGRNVDECLGMGLADNYFQHTPLLNTYLTDDIKIIDCEYDANLAVTVDDKVYIWGDSWYVDPWWNWYTPTEVTGLVIPPGETIVQAVCCPYGLMVLLSDNSLWAAGQSEIFGDREVTPDTPTFVNISAIMAGKGTITQIRVSALGSFGVSIIADGNIWGWGDDLDDYTGLPAIPGYLEYEPNLCVSNFEGQHNFVDVVFNTHNQCAMAIDDQGYLWTWGGQWWGPHLAIGAKSTAGSSSYEQVITDVVRYREIAGYADQAIALNHTWLPQLSDFTTHNLLPSEESKYWQPEGQDLRHRPCGHWHLREFFVEEDNPKNCWMPALAIKDNILLFAAAGRWAKDLPGSGNETLMFTYDIDANIWTRVMYEEGRPSANAPGGAAIDTDIYAYANWKADQTGSVFNEVYTNFGVGVWAYDVTLGAMNYTDFLDSKADMYMANKVAVYAGGVVAIAYTDNAGQLLVRVSTDYGVTWNLRKTIGALAARKDFSLVIDQATGYIFLAHQVSTSAVMVEQSVDNGLNWTTRIASNYLTANMLKVKLVSDGDKLILFGASLTALAIEVSYGTYGTSWGTISGEPAATIIASGSDVEDGSYDRQFVVAAGPMYNYIYDIDGYGNYTWLERDTHGLAVGGPDASLAGYGGRFAYSNFNFHKAPDPFILVLVSNDMGVTWDVRETPLNHYEDGEFPDFTGCPLFCLTDVPYLNHIWTFEKSNWAERCGFVKQKDKYVSVTSCACIKCK